jgi:hypothetical protein
VFVTGPTPTTPSRNGLDGRGSGASTSPKRIGRSGNLKGKKGKCYDCGKEGHFLRRNAEASTKGPSSHVVPDNWPIYTVTPFSTFAKLQISLRNSKTPLQGTMAAENFVSHLDREAEVGPRLYKAFRSCGLYSAAGSHQPPEDAKSSSERIKHL